MANTKQAKKRIRINARRRLRNMAVRSSVKTAFKKARVAISEKRDRDEAMKLVINAVRLIDKAVSKGIIHKNTAARKKSRLMRAFNKAFEEAESVA